MILILEIIQFLKLLIFAKNAKHLALSLKFAKVFFYIIIVTLNLRKLQRWNLDRRNSVILTFIHVLPLTRKKTDFMKKIITLYFTLNAMLYCAQDDKQKFLLSLSAGSHLNFYQWQGVYGVPFNFQADLLFSERNSIGIGYVYDSYKGDNTFFSTTIRAGNIRHNLNIRYHHYFGDPQRIFCTYLGGSAGLSIWEPLHDHDFTLRPTAQFVFGMRLKIYKGLFWIHEFGAGPPFLYQSSIGIRF